MVYSKTTARKATGLGGNRLHLNGGQAGKAKKFVPHGSLQVLTLGSSANLESLANSEIEPENVDVFNVHQKEGYVVVKFGKPGQELVVQGYLVQSVDGTPDKLYKDWPSELWALVHEHFEPQLELLRDLQAVIPVVYKYGRHSLAKSALPKDLQEAVRNQGFYGNSISKFTKELFECAITRTNHMPKGPDPVVENMLSQIFRDLKDWVTKLRDEGRRMHKLIGDNSFALEKVKKGENDEGWYIARDCRVNIQTGEQKYDSNIGGYIDKWAPDTYHSFYICGKGVNLNVLHNGKGSLWVKVSPGTGKCVRFNLGQQPDGDQKLESYYTSGRKFFITVSVTVLNTMMGHTVQAVRANMLDEAVIGVELKVKAKCTYGGKLYTREVPLEMVVCKDHRVQINA